MKESVLLDIISKVILSRLKPNDLFSHPKVIEELIHSAIEIFSKEDNILKLNDDFIVVGDIHGNINDLIRIFDMFEWPVQNDKKYLFLGDLVDRGEQSTEVILLLYSLKVLFPQNIYLIRGNHESESVCLYYGFKSECTKKLSNRMYLNFLKSFDYLPYAAIVNQKIFCVHGGISPDTGDLNQIAQIKRPINNDQSQQLLGLVWSDPRPKAHGFQRSDRGVGFIFNDQKLNQFLKRNDLELMIRSHEVIQKGGDRPLKKCITIFSNTDYCGGSNLAAICIIKNNPQIPVDDSLKFEVFSPLIRSDKKQKQIKIPEWILMKTNENAMKQPTQDANSTDQSCDPSLI